MRRDYAAKFASFAGKTLYEKLPPHQQEFLRRLAFALRFTFQEFRQVVAACRDLSLWGEGDLESWWRQRAAASAGNDRRHKQRLLAELQVELNALRRAPKTYPLVPLTRPKQREKNLITVRDSDKNIFGMCPVASEKTVCCNLRTIDVVENCIFGCSYCSIQTFYSAEIVFDARFAEKLAALELQPDRFYHIGTGQSSDSLAWGNRHGILDALCRFAAAHPNILLELKTKSDNVRYFLEREVPANVVISWSLNTPIIIANEEHFTASLEKRLAAARQVADRGLGVAFHFHPMVYYDKWQEDYPAVAAELQQRFDPSEVRFLSFGSVTLIKPVLHKIRELGYATKISQMEMVPDPHGKLTYPDEIKVMMFRRMYEAFAPWHGVVFFYLCMEKAEIWRQTFGYVYPDNETFEAEFGRRTRR
ncbi:MAG: hypothetical protein ONB56_05675 [candidate division KSB1 bacterium]|nr:hypothetical protein [candidate division KSB1 bacterium]MDZ7395326.1 hypothetical protein [candidate division KSB1 bacterium]MDZ7410205.1 hypothetical protein [candidate division KSB1 bacterium]